MTDISGIVAIVVALGTLAWTIIRSRSELAKVSVSTAIDLSKRMEELEAALDRERDERRMVELRLEEMSIILRQYRHGTDLLVEQLQFHRINPVWTPPGWPKLDPHPK